MTKQPILELKNINKKFGDKIVLNQVNFQINRGEIVGYIGPNGAGKSTTVKIILGLLSATAGDIYLFGQRLTDKDTSYKKRIGYVPENAKMYDQLSAKEYFIFIGALYGLSEDIIIERGQRLMSLLGIDEVAYNARLSTYSKGMRQKTLIVSSLLHDPDLLFWDEPLNGLDANSIQIIKEILRQLRDEGKTIIYSSHIMSTVEKLSDRILLLHEGKVVADDSFDSLRQVAAGNLEQVFNQLTGFNDHKQVADEFMAVLKEE